MSHNNAVYDFEYADNDEEKIDGNDIPMNS